MKKGNKYSVFGGIYNDYLKQIKDKWIMFKTGKTRHDFYSASGQSDFQKFVINAYIGSMKSMDDSDNDRWGIDALSLLGFCDSLSPKNRNYYISSKRLFDFLISCPIKNCESINNLDEIRDCFCGMMNENEINTDNGYIITKKGKINIWNNNHSIIFTIGYVYNKKNIERESYIFIWLCNGTSSWYNILKNEMYYDSGNDEEYTKYSRLVFNLLLYMEAYPHLISSEPPPFFIKLDKGKQSYTINPNPDLISEDGSFTHEVSPHFRSGHFRRLMSDRFTHKKGQIVFVRSTFVKKNALQVIDKDEAIIV